MNRRSFIAGAASLAVSSPAAAIAPSSCAADDLAECLRLFRALSPRDKLIAIDLLKALVELPEGADAEPLFAEARRRRAEHI